MSDDINLSLNGHSKVPPGFRFHPTEEELLQYYLRKKLASQTIDLDVIRDVDLNKLEPWDIQDKCRIGSTPQNDWYFFSHKDKKYPTGTRTNRATAAGFWKATGRDKAIHTNFRRIGMRKTLVFYRGRAPHGQKSDWIMHEYRLEDDSTANASSAADSSSVGAEEGWVVCRVFKKKNYHKAMESPLIITPPRNDGVLDQILMYMGSSRSCKPLPPEKDEFMAQFGNNPFMLLPSLETHHHPPPPPNLPTPSSDWAALDRLVASQLNGGEGHHPCKQLFCGSGDLGFSFEEQEDSEAQLMMNLHDDRSNNDDEGGEGSPDIWNFAQSSSSLSSTSGGDPLCHLSV